MRGGSEGAAWLSRVRRGSDSRTSAAVRQTRVQISEEALYRAEAMKRTEVVFYEYINIVYLLEIKKSGSVPPNPTKIYKQVSLCPLPEPPAGCEVLYNEDEVNWSRIPSPLALSLLPPSCLLETLQQRLFNYKTTMRKLGALEVGQEVDRGNIWSVASAFLQMYQ